MKPEPFFEYDRRSYRIRIKQNHLLVGRIQITIEPAEFYNAKGWNKKTRLPRDVHQAGRPRNLINVFIKDAVYFID